jgi:phosphate transport system substrate-binding protein
MKGSRILFIITTLAILLTGCQSGTSPTVTPASSKNITNVGSDTLINLALAWAERYQQKHTDVQISVSGGGSGTGITALLNGTVDIANASRAMTADEINQAKAQGFEPVQFVVARDAIAVIVNPNNPVAQLTLQQLSAIYKGEITNWNELGGEDRPIVKLSRESNSGTHVYFLEKVIRLGSKTDKSIFAPDTLLLPSSEGIISEVSDNPNAIGYDGLGYVSENVKVLAVAKDAQSAAIIPSAISVNDGKYPISRDLYMYTHGQPSGTILDYLNWILSNEAQQIVTSLGFVPIVGAGK